MAPLVLQTEVGHQGWYPAVGLTDSSSQIQTNFGATEYVFDAAEFLQAGSVSFSAFADLAVDEDRSDHEFVPQLMRTTRELLQVGTPSYQPPELLLRAAHNSPSSSS